MEENFNFWMPIEAIEKSTNGREKNTDSKRWIQGIASTRATDYQGEVVVPEGIDTSYFMSGGYFNADHRKGVENKVGEPTDCKITKDGLWVKGFLYEGKKASDDVWEHLLSLKKSGARRKLGFSIEGKVVRRAGNVIEKCWLMDVAITPSPVNHTTWAEITKSLSGQPWVKPAKRFTFEEAVEFIKQTEKLNDDDAQVIASLIFKSLEK